MENKKNNKKKKKNTAYNEFKCVVECYTIYYRCFKHNQAIINEAAVFQVNLL